MIFNLPFIIFSLVFATSACLVFIDRRKKRDLPAIPAASFLVPCFNNARHVGQALASIYETAGSNADVVVVDDCSFDGSRELLRQLQRKYRFRLVRNRQNIGKAATLNAHVHFTRHGIVAFVDADVILNKKSLLDAFARLRSDEVGAVSCPYAPQNKGIIPLMQHIEYNMLAFIQGAYNLFSAISLWGGFIVIKKKAFLEAGGFSLNAITEDMDLAFKLNEKGWKVEQSFIPVRTYVPAEVKGWYRQKIRWSSGGFQCFCKYYKIWLRNPLHLFFVFSYSVLLAAAVFETGRDVFLWDQIFDYFISINRIETVFVSLKLTNLKYGFDLLKDMLFFRLALTLISLPFVMPLISGFRKVYLCFMVIPYSIFYLPAFSAVFTLGAVHFMRRRRTLKATVRAW
jgi:poly-beta-1,6-N-acetyl-D-glucosamine synthase